MSGTTAAHGQDFDALCWRWHLDPEAQLLEVFRREGDFWVLIGTWSGEDKVRAEPFEAVELRMGDWWEGVEPPPAQAP